MLWVDYKILLIQVKSKSPHVLLRFQFLIIHFVKQFCYLKLAFVKVQLAHELQSID